MEKKNNIVYLDLDSGYYFIESTELEKNIIDRKFEDIEIIKENIKTKSLILESITSKYLEKIFPELKEKEKDTFSFSQSISKYFCKKKDIKKHIEKNISYLFLRKKLSHCSVFSIQIEHLEILGNILSYIFSVLDKYNINNRKELREKIARVKERRINVMTEFFNYCSDNKLDVETTNKTKFWNSNNKKYDIPPELIFLIIFFNSITIFDFNINCLTKSFDEDHLKYIMIVLMNLDIFLVNVKHVKLHLIHEEYQKSYNILDLEKTKNAIYPNSLEINISNDVDNLFSKKWNFEHNFMLEEFRNTKKKTKKKGKIDNYNFDIISKEDVNMINQSFIQSGNSLYRGMSHNINISNNNNYRFVRNKTAFFPRKQTLNSYIIQKENQKNIIDIIRNQIFELFSNYRFCFEAIFILFYAFSNYKAGLLDLIMNNSYNTEIIEIFKNFYKIDIKEEYNDYHILDFFSNPLKLSKSLNIEIDSFDLATVERITQMIHLNTFIKSIKLSFFTSDINYFPHKLLKMYLISLNKTTIQKNNETYENFILSEFYPFFKENLLYLFYLIKGKNLNSLGLNFDIPLIVQKRSRYMMAIMKFILNFLIYLNDSNCILKDLTILSPNTILDGRTINSIDKIFEEMDCNKNNIYLTELNLQFKIYEMPHIKNVITNNLIKLRIGNLDIATFESLTNHLNSYNFARYSLLKELNIKLMKNIGFLSTKIKIIFRTLFNVKLKYLKHLCLCTNITIKTKKDCSFFTKILSDNWISSYTFLFNENSKNLFKKYINTDEITFLVPHNLENELVCSLNNKNISTNPDDIVYWYLKYLFNKSHYYRTRNFKAQKYYIYNILKYLYCEKKIKIFYETGEDK